MLQLVHLALCGVVTGLLIVRGPKPLALALALVLGLSVGALSYNHVAWHVLAPFACLAGVAESCERRGFFTALAVGGIWAAVITFVDLPQLETGYLIAGAHAFAFFYGRDVFKRRKKMSVHATRRIGIVIASCAMGAVGALLWAHGLTTVPAQCSDVLLFLILIVLSAC
jgi:xanthosine utilization system XapX-like protein